MRNSTSFEFIIDDPGQALAGLLHHGSSPLLLLIAALLGTFGLGIAAKTFFRGNTPRPRPSLAGLAANVGGAAWLLPIAAVFTLYVLWMRPSLTSPEETSSKTTLVKARANESPSTPSGRSLPEWANDKGITAGDTRLVVVTGEIGATVDEASAAARAAAFELVRADFLGAYPQAAGWEPPAAAASNAAIRRTFVEEIDRKTLSTGTPFTVYRAYDQVELSPDVRKQLLPAWKDQIVSRRIWALGGLAGLLTLTFGTLAAYFRLDHRTAGLYRRRLKLAAVSVIAAGGLAATTLL